MLPWGFTTAHSIFTDTAQEADILDVSPLVADLRPIMELEKPQIKLAPG